MGRSLDDFPEQASKCTDCGKTTWETEHYACDCHMNECPDCCETFDPDLFPTIRGCFDHEEDKDELREMAADYKERVDKLKARVKELESRCRYKEAQIAETGEEALEELRA